jgi:hypothetical protein
MRTEVHDGHRVSARCFWGVKQPLGTVAGRLRRAVCTGAPIRDPITGRILGAVTLSCQIAPHSG